MKPTRGTILAGLVFVAVVAPLGAYAVTAGTDDDTSPEPAATHATKKPDKPAKPKHTTGAEHADDASAAGRAHAEAMKAWARCVAEAASGPKTGERAGPPKEACPDKPVGPGRAKHEAEEKSSGHGRSDSHRGQGRQHSR